MATPRPFSTGLMLVGTAVDPPPGLRNPRQAADRRDAFVTVAQEDAQDPLGLALQGLEVVDVAFPLEQVAACSP